MPSRTTRAVIDHYRDPSTFRFIVADTVQSAAIALKTLHHFGEVFRPTRKPKDTR